MPNFRKRLAQEIVDDNDVTLADFTEGAAEPHPQNATEALMEVIAIKVADLEAAPLRLYNLIKQHATTDILDLVPDWFQAKYGNAGEAALFALGIASLTAAVYDACRDAQVDDKEGSPFEPFISIDELSVQVVLRGVKVG